MASTRRASLATRLSTARLVLRAPRPSDLARMLRYAQANASHLDPWSPGAHAATLVTVASHIAEVRRAFRDDRAYSFSYFSRADDEYLGVVSLANVVRGAFQSAMLGYEIARAHQRKGLAREAVAAVCDFAFGALGLHRLQAAVAPSNAPSLRLLDALGFRVEGLGVRYLNVGGTWKDHTLLALTADEWAARKGSEGPSE